MPERPTLSTPRLTLRPFHMADCDRVASLCADRRIADTTLLIPHPFTLADAEWWLGTHQEQYDSGKAVNFAIDAGGEVVGAVGLCLEADHGRAEIGYWIGVQYWGKGYASEAAREVVRWGLSELGLNRVYAYHFARNAASGRVLQKAGMRHEGVQRGHVRKWDRYEDCVLYGAVRGEEKITTEAQRAQGSDEKTEEWIQEGRRREEGRGVGESEGGLMDRGGSSGRGSA